ncbi:DNA-binding transcriptional regulator, XRE-family HTH domain [Butyrivibrio sp. ob235]|uniref:helix-turn-helix domain-containing protein n=1 Tax=Butyrivibrio sp. ob235 TaxID=1761780 RepID=UPI0008C7A8EE|nr:helix-turn-helix transcriptional regulator [Butyrivibrio sp. ob235]SEL13149.1 DNA-binding transcriptional regulator, XRE-family HTH domain [Butyrivibrio sp. ob235]
MGFGDALQKARKDKNISQEELAEMIHVSRQSVSKWERGEGYPEVETLIEIARNLHLSIDTLMHEELSRITDFESISSLDTAKYGTKLKTVPIETIVKAYMGTSPVNAKWIESVFHDIDFDKEVSAIGRIKIQEIEAAQNEILATINS